MALKFDRRLRSIAAETPIKLQRHPTTLIIDLVHRDLAIFQNEFNETGTCMLGPDAVARLGCCAAQRACDRMP